MNKKDKEKIVKFFKEMIQQYDFQIIIDINKELENVFKLIDIQNGNLGGIEQEEFYTLSDIIERLVIYHQDYIYNELEEKQKNNEKIEKSNWSLIAKRYLENDTVANVLKEVHTNEYVDLISEKNEFKIQDIIKILDEDEKFYKNVCKKYIDTMSKEMLLEIDNKILHIYIEDRYINLKEKGQINETNYKQYLDGNFEVYEYDFYQDLYNSVIKDEIAYDLNDLELFDEKGKWNFYITFEELKKVGYGFMVKEQYPLIEKYLAPEEEIENFYSYFSLEELNEFERTLYLYYETDDIDYNTESMELYSKTDSKYNTNIIYISEGMLSLEDFIQDYIEDDFCITKVNLEENKVEKDEEIGYEYQ